MKQKKLPPKKKSPVRKRSPKDRLVGLCRELDVEMDGVAPIPATAAAILNGIRSVLNEIP